MLDQPHPSSNMVQATMRGFLEMVRGALIGKVRLFQQWVNLVPDDV